MSEANVVRGHKANLSNPNTSEESKQRSEEILEELGQGPAEAQSVAHQTRTGDTKDEGNVLRGHKAAMNNPNVSEEAQERSRQYVEKHE